MHIFFITHKYPPIIGGMERQSYELTTRVPQPHRSTVLAYKGEGNKLMWFINLKKKIKQILRENKDIDIIHVNDGLMAAATTWLKKYTDIPVVATYHGLDITFPSSIFQNRIIKNMHRLDAGICVSHATAQACIERNFGKKSIYTVLNGVDHDLADIEKDNGFLKQKSNELGFDIEGKKIIITMGRAVKRKGFSWFLREVLPQLPDDVLFLMIGPLNTKRSFGEKIINLLPKGIKSKVHLMFGIATDVDAIVEALDNPATRKKVHHLGKVPFTDLMQYLAHADVFVMPNIKVDGDAEGFGLVALEANLRGLPVIASGIEGITDAVRHDKNGMLLNTLDTKQWITTITKVLNDADALQARSQKAKAYVLENYGWDKMVAEYLEVFEKVVERV